MSGYRREIDSRAWLVWGAAVSVPLLTGRHPVLVAELLVIVLTVRTVSLPHSRRAGWGWLVRLGMIAVPIGVVFNMLTVHAGDRDLFRVPGNVPIVGGTVTLNAVAYGLLSGVTIVTLVAAGTTVAAGIDWSALMRVLPARAATIAVAGSVAWAFLPQLSTSWREVREAQAARGHRYRGVRDVVPLIVPVMAGGLDRSITMAEALESRGFGSSAPARQASAWPSIAIGGALTGAVAGLYLFAVGRSVEAGVVLLVAVTLGMLGGLSGASGVDRRPTHYREARWTRIDWGVTSGAIIAILATAIMLQVRPEALRYEPYPSLDWPVTSPILVLALALLLMPAVLAPAVPERGPL